jgi:hypothetical protein
MMRIALVLAVTLTALPAAAAGPGAKKAPRAAQGRVVAASLMVQRTGAELLSGRDAADSRDVLSRGLMASPSLALGPDSIDGVPLPGVSSHMAPKAQKAKPAIDYKAILDDLIITRDLQIPGAPTMAVRLIPGTQALRGSDDPVSPIVFTPRVVGSSWYGLDVAARF